MLFAVVAPHTYDFIYTTYGILNGKLGFFEGGILHITSHFRTARLCTAASDEAKSYSDKKVFIFGNILHITR